MSTLNSNRSQSKGKQRWIIPAETLRGGVKEWCYLSLSCLSIGESLCSTIQLNQVMPLYSNRVGITCLSSFMSAMDGPTDGLGAENRACEVVPAL